MSCQVQVTDVCGKKISICTWLQKRIGEVKGGLIK